MRLLVFVAIALCSVVTAQVHQLSCYSDTFAKNIEVKEGN